MYDSYNDYYGMYDMDTGGACGNACDEVDDAVYFNPENGPPPEVDMSYFTHREQSYDDVELTRGQFYLLLLIFAAVSGIVIFFGYGLVTCGLTFDAFMWSAMILLVAHPVQFVLWCISIAVFANWLDKNLGPSDKEHDPDKPNKTARNIGVITGCMADHQTKVMRDCGRKLLPGKRRI